MTNLPGVFAAGDMRRGQSPRRLGHQRRPPGGRGVDQFLMGKSDLPYLKLF